MTCPSCGSQRVFPSRARNILERLRIRITDTEPYRCRQCGWRGWRTIALRVEHPDVQPDDLRTALRTPSLSTDDLEPLDPAAGTATPVTDRDLDPLDPKGHS